jgi:hypothetical protein
VSGVRRQKEIRSQMSEISRLRLMATACQGGLKTESSGKGEIVEVVEIVKSVEIVKLAHSWQIAADRKDKRQFRIGKDFGEAHRALEHYESHLGGGVRRKSSTGIP